MTSPLTPELRLAYERDGLMVLPGGVGRADVSAMRQSLWGDLERRFGMKPGDPASWTTRNPAGFAELAKTGAFAAMASPVVTGMLDALLGAWVPPARWAVPLVTFPEADAPSEVKWDVPRLHWHLDTPATVNEPGIARVFVLLNDLEPRGGGTVVALGSHRLLMRIAQRAGHELRSADAKARLYTEEPWFAGLVETGGTDRVKRFMEDGAEIDGVSVRVTEMTGKAGDVLLMHPTMLHAASMNVSERPRMMLTQWIEAVR
jgi:hypothetical protein